MEEIALVKLQIQKSSTGITYRVTVPKEIVDVEEWLPKDKIRFLRNDNGKYYIENSSADKRKKSSA